MNFWEKYKIKNGCDQAECAAKKGQEGKFPRVCGVVRGASMSPWRV